MIVPWLLMAWVGAAEPLVEAGEGASSAPAVDDAAAVQLAEPRVEVRVLTPDVYVRGRVELDVKLYRDAGRPTPPPRFDDLTMGEAVAVRLQSGPPAEEVREDGTTWLVQTRRYQVYPLFQGTLRVPAVSVWWEEGDGIAGVRGEELTLDVALPPGVTPGMSFVAANLEGVTDSLDDLQGFVVGDAVQRTVEVKLKGLDGSMIPTLVAQAPDALRAYPEPPVRETRVERGVTHGLRREAVTYVADRVGRVVVPGFQLWTFGSDGQWRAAERPARVVWVRPNPSLGIEAFGPVPWVLSWGGFWLGVLLALGWGSWRGRAAYRAWMLASGRTTEERTAFRAFARAARSGIPQETLQGLYRWLDLRAGAVQTLAVAAGDDTELMTLCTALLAAAEGRGPWTPAQGRQLLQGWSKQRTLAERQPVALPPLAG